MRARRAQLIVGAVILAAIALLIALAARGPKPLPPRPAAERPTLLLLTSLPLIFGDSFSLQDTGSPAMKALGARYRVVPISVTDPGELRKGRLLLMAHPLAQPAEDLVALDAWVRGGGRVLLLADPMLEWPSERPLGDPMRPPPMFADTGLLAHWGLRLDAPDERGTAWEKLGGVRHRHALAGATVGVVRHRPRPVRRPLPDRQRRGDRRRRCGLPRRPQAGPRGQAQSRRADCRACFARRSAIR